MMGALLGLLFWNYPGGRIFLGDGGTYRLGFWLAELAVLLVARNPDVSRWLALLFCAAYVWLYLRLIHWRAPAWMIASPNRVKDQTPSAG